MRVKLRVDTAELSKIERAADLLFLGIIFTDGSVSVRAVDKDVWGHRDWIALDELRDVSRGFVLVVRNGCVRRLHSQSGLNPSKDCLLEPRFRKALRLLLPLCEDFVEIVGV